MRLALFFTCGVSLEKWAMIGNLEREIKPYSELSKQFEKIYFFTYGSLSDLKFQTYFPQNAVILPKKWKIPACFYAFLLPFFYWHILKETDILKTNQMASAVPAVIVKILFRHKKLVLRTGYEWLSFLQKAKKAKWKRTIVFLWEKIAYKAANVIIFSSQQDREFAQKKFNIPQRKTRFIPNYIDTDLFKPQAVEKEKGRLIFIGRLTKQKNITSLIESIAGLPVKLTIIGQGELKSELAELAKEKNAAVEFKDKVPNEQLPEILNKAEIFILSSFYEGCPKTLLEAMACSLPCIATNVEGIKEIIVHKENGFLCQTDSASIRTAILAVLNDKPLQEKLSKAARETILENFSLEKIIQQESALYFNICPAIF
ncbi:MAG: glycosyltransferase family 4 protein [Candidatus Pacebacteria bacterium]|nr:glycosyltransferase family 4 protein [Candidatus Paceibacterota bacterium]